MTPTVWLVTDDADTQGSATDVTLRYALSNAQNGDSITFAPTLSGQTITLSSSLGTLTISSNVSINGLGAANLAVSGNNAVEVFDVASGVTASISGLTVENGSASANVGGIDNQGTLTLNNVTLSGNSGYVIENNGGLTVNFGIFTSNTGDDIYCSIENSGNLAVNFSTFASNSGGGINNSGTMTVANCTFDNNVAGSAVGIYNGGSSAVGTISNSTFYDNTSNDGDGAITSSNDNAGGILTVTDCTIVGNAAYNKGGGIYNDGGTVNIVNSIVAENSAYGPTGGSQYANLANFGGSINGYGNNIIGGNPDTASSLANNGGPTQTLALLTGSPAIQAGTAPTIVATGHAIGVSDTTIYVNTAAAVAETPGTYILIDQEQMLITNVNTSANTLTVQRGVNGTTATTHAVGASVYLATDQRGAPTPTPPDIGAFELETAVTGDSPNSGTASGGTTVTISGFGFTGATAVNFGTTAATSFTVNANGTQITAIDPAGSGTVNVTVTTSLGTSATSSGDQFTYLANTTTTVTSPTNSTVYGQSVTLTATVTSSSTPTGSVEFFDETTNTDLGAGTPTNTTGTTATWTYSTSATQLQVTTSPAAQVIEAVYTPTGAFLGSSGTLSGGETITPLALTVSGITANNKVYDHTTAATLNTASATLNGVLSGDSVTLSTASAVGVFASKDVGNGITVNVSGLTISGAETGDYTLTQPTTSANITPASGAGALTVTGITANNKVYDHSTAATLNTGNAALVGVFSGDTVTLTTSGATGTFASKDVGNGITVAVTGLTLTGPQAGDYTLTQPTTSANITPASGAGSLTVTGIIANNKMYDHTTTATLNTAGASLVGVYSGDSVTLVTSAATGTFASKDVGNGITVMVSGLTLTGPQAGDYTLTQPTTSANISPASGTAALTVTGITADNKMYNHTTTATLNTAGANLLGVYSGDSVTLITSGATGTFASKDVGNGISVAISGLTLGGAQAGDYTLTQPTTSANITPASGAAALTVTGITANNKMYDHTTAATLNTGSAALVGVFSGDTVTLTTSGATGTFASKDVGNGITVTVSGLTLSGPQAADYTLTQPTTSANITPASGAGSLTVTGITANNKVYDHTTTASLNIGSAALSGVFSGDSVTLVTSEATGTFASKDVGNAITVSVSGLTLVGPQAADYTLTQPTTSANMTPATLTVSGITANNKVFDGTTSASLNTSGASLVGVFPGDSVTLGTSGATGTFATASVGTGITVTVTGLTIGGSRAEDYTLTQPTTSANITAIASGSVPEPVLVSGYPNGTAQEYTLNTSTGQYNASLLLNPFPGLGTDIRAAIGDVNGDGIPDYIFATGPGTPFEVTVISGAAGNPVLVAPFDPFLPAPPLPQSDVFTAGGFVSAGDFLGNGRDQIVVSPDQSGGPRVAIYDMNGAAAAAAQPYTPVGVNTQEVNPGSGLTRINNFLSVNPNFRGGDRTAVGDLNGDGVPDLAIAAGFGGGPAVLVINGTKVPTTDGFTASDDLIGDFFAFNSTLRDGAYLAIGDVLGNGQQDLILGPGAGGPAEVEVISGAQLLSDGAVSAISNPVTLFSPTSLGPDGSGMRVAVAASGVGDQVNVVVGAGRNMPGVVKVYPGTGFTSGSTSEPTGGQLLNPYNGDILADGIFVG